MGKRSKESYKRDTTRKNVFFEHLTGEKRMRSYRKMIRKIVFDWFVKSRKNRCIHCKQKVLSTEQWHIDHTKCFWTSDTPLETFLDLKYLRLAHAACNISHGIKKRRDLQW